MRWPIPQPVLVYPRSSKDTTAAFNSSVSSTEIKSPGNSPSIWDIWRWPLSNSGISSPDSVLPYSPSMYHSLICPLSPISTGASLSLVVFQRVTRSESTPNNFAAVIVSSYNCHARLFSYVLPIVYGPCSEEKVGAVTRRVLALPSLSVISLPLSIKILSYRIVSSFIIG